MAAYGGHRSLRDRTSEFLAITERLQGGQQGRASTPTSSETTGARRNAVQQQSDFAKKASAIGMCIHKTSEKLQKLSQLAKRTSMFDDPAEEINELTGVIKQDIQKLNSGIAELQSLSAAAGREGNVQTVNHSNTVVDNLRSRLKDATKQFKDVLTLRTENLKEQDSRRQLFSSSPENGYSVTEPLLGGSSLGPGKSAHSLFGGAGSSQAADSSGASSQQMQQQQLAPQDTYLDSRAHALQNVESTIVELGGIFQQLAHMVAEQGEMAVRIDDNVSDTLTNVSSAQTQLLKYLNNISSNRWLIIKIFSVLMVFLVIFVIFIA